TGFLFGQEWTQYSGIERNDIFQEYNEQPHEGDPTVLFNSGFQHLNTIRTQRDVWLLLSLSTQNWEDSVWVNDYQNTYNYDMNNNRTNYLRQEWFWYIWVNDRQYTYTYDANNNLTSHLSQNWDNDEWVNSFQATNTYDANNNRTGTLWQDWDGNEWVNSGQDLMTYDANDNMIGYLWQVWDGTEWQNSNQSTYTYDSNNNLISYLDQNWNGTEWQDGSQSTYTYDENNNNTIIFQQSWDGTEWVNSYQRHFTWGQLVPVISNIPDQEMDEDQSFVLNLSAQSPVSDALYVFSAYSDTSAVSLNVSSDTLHIVPAFNWTGSALITVVVALTNEASDTTSFNLIVHKTDPVITYIEDVPEDQGGWVYIGFLPSYHDSDTITSRSEMYSVERLDDNQWVNVASGVAYDEYEYV
ncbi:uncharacterized protein METZ01_LOCUS281966, partial [marine metagenome]